MKTIILVSRVLLGLMFLTFGLNGFFNFLSMPPHSGVAGQYLGALFVSNYLLAVFALEIVAGVLLLANRFVRLALVILAPILANIVLFHAFMAPEGFAPAVIGVALWAVIFHRERTGFSVLLVAKSLS